MTISSNERVQHKDIITNITRISRCNGANFFDRWAPVNTLKNVLSKEKAKLISNWLRNDQTFAPKVVNQILPKHPVKNKGSRAAK